MISNHKMQLKLNDTHIQILSMMKQGAQLGISDFIYKGLQDLMSFSSPDDMFLLINVFENELNSQSELQTFAEGLNIYLTKNRGLEKVEKFIEVFKKTNKLKANLVKNEDEIIYELKRQATTLVHSYCHINNFFEQFSRDKIIIQFRSRDFYKRYQAFKAFDSCGLHPRVYFMPSVGIDENYFDNKNNYNNKTAYQLSNWFYSVQKIIYFESPELKENISEYKLTFEIEKPNSANDILESYNRLNDKSKEFLDRLEAMFHNEDW